MITAIDTSVLLDIFADDPTFRDRSLAAVRVSLASGTLVACEVVCSEVAAAFPDARSAEAALLGIAVTYSPLDAASASRAGVAWRAYRKRGGPRGRLIADFLVGAHAIEQADRLLTRDRGFQRAAFARLAIVDPSRD